jgi:tetratricopeptide (TPR) repeat protein
MNRRRVVPRYLVAALLGGGAVACKNKDGAATTAPSAGGETADTGTRPGPRTDASGNPIPQLPPGASEAPEVQEKQGQQKQAPLPQDRDPEEEKRKMAQSREVSAKAKQALRGGDLTRAIEESRQALRIHEQNVEAMLVIAEAFFKQGKWEITQGVATSVLDVDARVLSPEESSQAFNLRGFAYLAEGKAEAAQTMFRSAAEMDAKNATAWNNLGVQYMLDGDWDTAATCFKYASEVAPNLFKARLNYGAALRGQGKLLEAEQLFNQMLDARPDYAEAHFNLGVLYLDAQEFPNLDIKGRYNKAIQKFTKYKELAIAQGAKSPGDATTKFTPVETAMLSSRTLVSPEQADLYIEMAKKGIEREERREEREQKRKEKEARDAAKKAAKEGAEGGEPAPADGGDAAPPSDEPAAPADPPAAQKPGQQPADPPAAQKPGQQPADPPPTQKPGGLP